LRTARAARTSRSCLSALSRPNPANALSMAVPAQRRGIEDLRPYFAFRPTCRTEPL
jgi:hypothetical protein